MNTFIFPPHRNLLNEIQLKHCMQLFFAAKCTNQEMTYRLWRSSLLSAAYKLFKAIKLDVNVQAIKLQMKGVTEPVTKPLQCNCSWFQYVSYVDIIWCIASPFPPYLMFSFILNICWKFNWKHCWYIHGMIIGFIISSAGYSFITLIAWLKLANHHAIMQYQLLYQENLYHWFCWLLQPCCAGILILSILVSCAYIVSLPCTLCLYLLHLLILLWLLSYSLPCLSILLCLPSLS